MGDVSWRAETVGSLLRPAELRDAMLAGTSDLRALQDRAVLDALALQQEVGLPVVNDGEMRRRIWHGPVLDVADGFDPEGFTRTWTAPDGRTASHTSPVVTSRLTERGSLVDVEAAFVLAHTDRPVKVTLPVPTNFLSYWTPGVSDRAYADPQEFLDDLVAILQRQARALVDAGVRYLQLDAPKYTFLDNRLMFPEPENWADQLATHLRTDRRVFDGLPDDVVTGIHICRGNYRSMFESTVPYDEMGEVLFSEARYDRLLLEYDDARAGGFDALRHVRPESTVVLGLVTTKHPELEDVDDLRRRIDAAAEHLPLDRLALSPQCGFASTWEGNELSADDQRRKLETVVRTADLVWS
ncbi:cobalamin-independent methionine synthase II family protein [Actinomycetospora chibensis]|uniref:Cobalamin-independent methionine synthase II family protein n=1 Tax=Actinomycetospora chibensis TaxID=663606 RepID=A0ABV9RAX0_9PSEU|nr:cobalamin-independent methionine synthase II family protein [Actinomycetospora chibensis]MDD7924228.1 cobalamin-independent methionine synthase II family protein [Actinomycetospora chibensis]